MNGIPLTTLREGDQQIPVVARLRLEERAQIADVQNLYVTSVVGRRPARCCARCRDLEYGTETEKIRRRNQFRTITVATFPVPGALPSEVMNAARAGLTSARARRCRPATRWRSAARRKSRTRASASCRSSWPSRWSLIFLALVIQFKNAVKPLIVFADHSARAWSARWSALAVMGTPFGFMAFLGIASLIGVIVSHVIVLFDFIEEKHAKGEPLEDALLDAGIVRLRPVLITVGATVFALFPLALHGGPLWEPLCYAQIGGLTLATFGTLLLVPVLYAIFVLDLRLVKWEPAPAARPSRGDGVLPVPPRS